MRIQLQRTPDRAFLCITILLCSYLIQQYNDLFFLLSLFKQVEYNNRKGSQYETVERKKERAEKRETERNGEKEEDEMEERSIQKNMVWGLNYN